MGDLFEYKPEGQTTIVASNPRLLKGAQVVFPTWELSRDWRSRLRAFILDRIRPFHWRMRVARVIGWPKIDYYEGNVSIVTGVDHETGVVTFDVIPNDLDSQRVMAGRE